MPTTKRRRRPAPATPAGFADQLRQLITGRNLTAYAVARSAGVAPSVVSRFLSRERGLTLETFDAVAGALGLRLVESGRGKGRPARTISQPDTTVHSVESMDGADDAPETHQKLNKLDTCPGPELLEDLVELVPEEEPRKFVEFDTQEGGENPTNPTPPETPETHRKLDTQEGPDLVEDLVEQAPLESDKIGHETAADALHFLAPSDAPPDVSPAPEGTPDGDGMPEITAQNATDATPGEASTRADDDKRPDGPAAEEAPDAIGHMVMDDDGGPPACLARAQPEGPPAEGETAEAAPVLQLVAGWPPEWCQEHENLANLLASEDHSWDHAQAEAYRRLADEVGAGN
jgi:transcriptional regulator with XRE-family HTH domain